MVRRMYSYLLSRSFIISLKLQLFSIFFLCRRWVVYNTSRCNLGDGFFHNLKSDLDVVFYEDEFLNMDYVGSSL